MVNTKNVILFQGTALMRVSLIGGQCSILKCNVLGTDPSSDSGTITAPPNAFVCPPGWFQLFIPDGLIPSHSRWVRIGGDPSQLGLWPILPGFSPLESKQWTLTNIYYYTFLM